MSTAFRAEEDWSLVEAQVTQRGGTAVIRVMGDGDLESAVGQVLRSMSLDVDASDWPGRSERDPILADAQARLQGVRPRGFHSPYEAAAWAVLVIGARGTNRHHLWSNFVRRYGEAGAFPTPHVLLEMMAGIPGQKPRCLRAVAQAALQGQLNVANLRSLEPKGARALLEKIRGLGAAGAELVMLGGVNCPDLLPQRDEHLEAGVRERYGPIDLIELSQAWRPFRRWAAFYLSTMHRQRGQESRLSGMIAEHSREYSARGDFH